MSKLQMKPFPHFIIPNFLPDDEAVEIFRALLKEKFNTQDTDLFTFLQTNDLVGTYNSTLQKFRKTMLEFIPKVAAMTNIQLKSDAIDMAGTLYKDSHYLLPHDDKLEGRKIAYIYYLSTLDKENGGAFTMYSGNKVFKRIQPEFNTLLLFIVSPGSIHQVEEVISADRYAISGWFL